MTRPAVVRLGALAAVVSGICWVVKAGGIMITGNQPPVVFEAALGLFPVALLGLYAVICGGGRLATSGLVLACAAALSAVTVGLVVVFGPDDWVPREDKATVLTPFIVVAGFGAFASLVLLGMATRRTSSLPGRWRNFPLTLGVSAVPLMVAGAALEAVHERLFEVPILLLGLGWCALGYLLGRTLGSASTETRARRPQPSRAP